MERSKPIDLNYSAGPEFAGAAPAESFDAPPIGWGWGFVITLGVVAGGIIRFLWIGNQSLWFDEGYTAWMVGNSPGEIVRLLRADTAPPLYYLLLHGWTGVFGHSEAALRSMSAFLSVLTLGLALPLARRFIRRPAGVAAAVWTLALSLTQLQFAQEARFYALMAFLMVALLYCLCRYLGVSGSVGGRSARGSGGFGLWGVQEQIQRRPPPQPSPGVPREGEDAGIPVVQIEERARPSSRPSPGVPGEGENAGLGGVQEQLRGWPPPPPSPGVPGEGENVGKFLHASLAARWPLIPISLLVAASLYTHNMMLPYLFAFGLVWLILPSGYSFSRQNLDGTDGGLKPTLPESGHSFWRRIVDGSIVLVVAVILYCPWAIGSLADQFRMVHANFWVEKPKAFDVAQIMASLAGVRHYWLWDWQLGRWHIPLRTDGGATTVGLVALILSAIVSIGFQTGARRRNAIALGMLALFPPLAVALYSLVGRPVFIEKVFLPSAALLPIFIMLPLGMPLSRPWRIIAWIVAGLFMLSVAFTALAFVINQDKENWRLAAQIIRRLPDHRRLIIFDGNDGQLPFDFYYHDRPDERETGVPVGFFDRNPPRAMVQVNGRQDMQPLRSMIEAGGYDEAILVMGHMGWSDKDYLGWKTLAEIFPFEDEIDQYKVRDILIVRFDKTQRP